MSSQINAITTPSAPKPNGNYSHVAREGNTLHVCKFDSNINYKIGDGKEMGKQASRQIE